MLLLRSLANSAPEELLLAFPPKDPEVGQLYQWDNCGLQIGYSSCTQAAKDAKSIFGAGYAELNQMVGSPGVALCLKLFFQAGFFMIFRQWPQNSGNKG